MDRFKIVMTAPGRGEVYRNGERLERVSAVEFKAGVNEPATVTVTFLAAEVEIEAEADCTEVRHA